MTSTKNNKHKEENKSADAQEPVTMQYLMKTLQDLQSEHEALKRELLKSGRIPSSRIGAAMLITGSSVLVASVLVASVLISSVSSTSSATLAFIGLGLTFWGALFLFTRPVRFVRSTLLDSTAIASYSMVDRIVQDLGYKAKSIYVPPYPKEAYLPEYLKGLKEMVVFIPAEDSATMPTIEEMAKKHFLLKNPKGICITPPGFGLSNVIENELRSGFRQIAPVLTTEYLYDLLPKVITRNLELAKSFEIQPENELIHVRITGSVYSSLYSKEQGLRSVHFLGCPLTSAIACALARATGKLVTIAKDNIPYDLQTIDVWYQTLEA